MEDEQEYSPEEPLDFSRSRNLISCPYCGETVAAEELENYLPEDSNTFVCPNCRKKLNIHELGGEI